MLINYFSVILSGFLLSIFFIFLFKKFAFRHKVLISQGIPVVGGIAIGLSFVLICLFCFFLYRSLLQEIMGVIVSSLMIIIFGIVDDWKELSVPAKFLVQIIATVILILFGIRTQIVYIGDLLNIIITFVWVLGITNAFNHLDIIDGLAGGVALIVSCAFFVVSLLNGEIETSILALALSSAIFGFLIYNLPPAKIYMGNSGSHFLGFILAAVALVISYAPLERKIALLSPLLILGFPIFDTTFLILMRLKQKKLIFKKSNDHLALRFLKLGYSKNKTLLFMLLLGLFFSLSGVLLSQVFFPLGIVVIMVVILVSLIITYRMSKVSLND